MKPYVRGKTIFFREVTVDDAEFILDLRTDPEKGKYLSLTASDLDKQKSFIASYLKSQTDFYFIICDWNWKRLGTIRIYDIQGDSFSWGSWILSKEASVNAAIESVLLLYDFAFFALHYRKSHFNVRKENQRVLDFHKRFGALVVAEDDLDFYFEYDRDAYASARRKYRRYLPQESE